MAKLDEELLAMARIEKLLGELSPTARRRVLSWINSRQDNPEMDCEDEQPTAICKHPGYSDGA